jgi:hypothetical protein
MSTANITIGSLRANLPVLEGQANYRRWANSWFVVLRGAKYWSVITDGERKEVRPIETRDGKSSTSVLDSIEEYDERNDAAHAAVLAGVSPELQDIVASCALELESARVAWNLLKEKFDHETTTSTLDLFNNFLDLKMEDGSPISDHISKYESSYQHILSRCAGSKRAEAKALHGFLAIEEVKIMCLFRSLPQSLENVVDNLSTKESLKYANVNKRLMDLQTTRSIASSSTSSKAYTAKTEPKQKECTWCKKQGHKRYTGHVHTDCRKLKAHKESSAGKSKDNESNNNKANVATTSQPDNSQNAPTASDFATEKAFVAQYPSASTTTWTLDSACTAQKDLFTKISPHGGSVTVGTGKQTPTIGRGTIELDLRLSDNTTVAATLNDVLYVPGLLGGNLISESVLEKKGFCITSSGGHRRVLKDGKEWMYAVADLKMSSSEYVIQQVVNKACFSSYIEAHKVFGHSGASVMERMSNLCPTIIPPKPEIFHCPSCALSKSTHSVPPPAHQRASKPFELLHSDLSGNFSTSLDGNQYYIAFIDDFSRFAWVYFLKKKSDTTKAIKDILKRIQTQYIKLFALTTVVNILIRKSNPFWLTKELFYKILRHMNMNQMDWQNDLIEQLLPKHVQC